MDFIQHTPTRPLNSLAHGGPELYCSVAEKGVGGLQGAAAGEKGWENGGGASGKGLGDGNRGAPQAQDQALWEVAGCRGDSPEEEPGGGSFHPGALATGRGGSGGGGGGDYVHWGGDGCCCH